MSKICIDIHHSSLIICFLVNTMQLRSFGYRTDLIFARFEGRITDKGDYLVIQTPSNPTFYWGNFLLFAHPPQPGDYERWTKLFAQEIGSPEQVGHIALAWDNTAGETGEVAPFLAAGFELDTAVALTARQVQLPPKFNPDVQVRALESEEDWETALQNQIVHREPKYSLEGYTTFRRAKMASYRAMVAQGLGHWFGAFVNDEMAGDLGLFVDSTQRGIGRFQFVTTYPDFRRQGVCSTLVYKAAQFGLTSMGLETLVMIADEDYFAARIYESVGFQPAERLTNLQWVANTK